MPINTINLLALNASTNYNIITSKKAKTSEKLSSGYRINRAADDAAGLQISEKMRSQIRGLNQGMENTQNGISMLQVADGALNEVHDILQRMNELSIKAENGTNTSIDRDAVQSEIEQLTSEIDRISNSTQFNHKNVFQGTDKVVLSSDGKAFSYNEIPFADITLTDISLAGSPFDANASGKTLALSASTLSTSKYSNVSWNLIFGNGSTSNSSIRINDSKIINLAGMQVANYNYDTTNNRWSRTLSYQDGTYDISLKQSVSLGSKDAAGETQYYDLTYEVTNNSANNMNIDFMFHADTAYNNNDTCEQYFTNNALVTNNRVYTSNADYLASGSADVYASIPASFSIVDSTEALPFTEKIVLDTGNAPDTFSIGQYSRIDDWSYYSNLSQNLGATTKLEDLGFSMIWSDDSLTAGGSSTYALKYGIAATNADPNVAGVGIAYNTNIVTQHEEKSDYWIQSGAAAKDGSTLIIGEMNSRVLNIKDLDVHVENTAGDAAVRIQNAISAVAKIRTTIGAEQNRLEHTYQNVSNIAENLQEAESKIRDTDIASQMMEFSKSQIIEEAAQSILAQANQFSQGILELLR